MGGTRVEDEVTTLEVFTYPLMDWSAIIQQRKNKLAICKSEWLEWTKLATKWCLMNIADFNRAKPCRFRGHPFTRWDDTIE